MNEITADLERLVQKLDAAAGAVSSATRGDAIDVTLREPARKTSVQSLRNAPEIEAFRNELIDGLIRADTANRLLNLVATIVEKML